VAQFLSGEWLNFSAVRPLRVPDFYYEQNQWLYDACLSLYQRDEAINQITVAQELSRRGRLESCEGAAHLNYLISICPTSLDIEHYARIVSRLSVMRQLISAGDRITSIGYEADPNVEDILGRASDLILSIRYAGELADEIWPSEDDTLEADYLLEPILYLNHPTVIFGDYGSLKSLLALVIAYVVQLPYQDNNLGLITAKEPTRCLYLDFEDDVTSFRKRWSALDGGIGEGAMPILRRRMTSSVSESVEQLRRIIRDNNIGLLIVDSLGPAARGNLNDPEPAIRYHLALRQLGITSLTLAHTAKDQLTRSRSIFGSVFFTNLARSVWEVKAEQETGEDEAVISLKHTKANLSRIHPPLGFKFSFTDTAICVAKAELKDTGLSGELPITWQIKNLLRSGALTTKEIAEALGKSESTIGRTLRRMKKKSEVVKIEGDRWGLPEEVGQ